MYSDTLLEELLYDDVTDYDLEKIEETNDKIRDVIEIYDHRTGGRKVRNKHTDLIFISACVKVALDMHKYPVTLDDIIDEIPSDDKNMLKAAVYEIQSILQKEGYDCKWSPDEIDKKISELRRDQAICRKVWNEAVRINQSYNLPDGKDADVDVKTAAIISIAINQTGCNCFGDTKIKVNGPVAKMFDVDLDRMKSVKRGYMTN